MTESSNDRDIGKLQADMQTTFKMFDTINRTIERHADKTDKRFDAMEASLDTVLTKISETNGGWKVLVAIGGGVGASITFGLIKIAPLLTVFAK